MSFKEEGKRNCLSISNKDAKMKNIEILKKNILKLSYEETILELENILIDVQDENISLDKMQSNYIKGNLLLEHCEKLLEVAEQEINEIDSEFLK